MNYHYHLDKAYFQNPLEYEELCVLQIGRMFCNNTTVIDSHVHIGLFELTIVTDGAGTISTNGIPTRVKKGDIYLSFPCDVHKIETDPEKLLKFDFFAFRVNGGSLKDEFERIAQNYHSPNTRVFQDDRIRPLIGNAIAEMDGENIYCKELLTSIFRQVLIYVIRGFQQIKLKSPSADPTHSEMLCYKLMHYMDSHLYSMKSLEQLSDAVDYSYGYLSAIFKKTTSITLSTYYHEKKMDEARRLLLENKLTITEIAERLNYASVYAFSKAFHHYFGAAPRLYQKQKTEKDRF